MTPFPHYDSAHHKETTEGDTFGGLGTDREFREEDIPAISRLQRVEALVQKPPKSQPR